MAQFAQQFDRSAPQMANGEALAKVDFTRVECPDQETLDKIFRRYRGQFRSEVEHQYLVNPEQPQPLHLLCECLEQRWCRLRPDNRSWMRIEGDNRWHCANGGGALDDPPNNLPMAKVETVKDPESADRRSRQLTCFCTANYLHYTYKTICRPS